MNIHLIHGRLTRDPEFTRGQEEKSDRAKFTVAVDRRYGDETDFIDCTVFGKRAGVIEKYFHKGSEIIVSGEGQVRSYEDRNGVKRKSYSVIVADFDFCGSRSDGNGANTMQTSTTPATVPADPEPSFEEIDEDIPF